MSKKMILHRKCSLFLFIKSSFLNKYNITLKTTIEFIDLMHKLKDFVTVTVYLTFFWLLLYLLWIDHMFRLKQKHDC